MPDVLSQTGLRTDENRESGTKGDTNIDSVSGPVILAKQALSTLMLILNRAFSIAKHKCSLPRRSIPLLKV